MQVNTSIANQTQTHYKKTIANTQENTKNKNLKPSSLLSAQKITDFYLIYFEQQTFNMSINTSNTQAALNAFLKNTDLNNAQFILSNIDFTSLSYNGKNPLNMDANELEQLISEEGFFGVQNTANRIADFIIKNSGDDIEKLKQGLKGMNEGFKEAKQMWGGELPKISQDTMQLALQKVHDRMEDLKEKSLDLQA
ncbi:hypothetical protein LNU06_01465 [Campylobacter sp. VicNov18]|uniref:hypothetical protein n=1 Tax=Campylobacter bilis TaxID=2691918 RepID=UPI00130E188E|nr:hypothetical protein [Campylobacter bilis]MPV63335.1 hypothetical protein [Campylobacter hepaticus]MBM0636834.1 hypothetical protein [Campylobacter bilis]MCC8277405.1 hypothetical protein [Campylobacter bilis]MCC8299148.1 hypothetical protein [Campylobacter bilis]MCC8300314.1 hypothetical protein [Campylobacter bilis]